MQKNCCTGTSQGYAFFAQYPLNNSLLTSVYMGISAHSDCNTSIPKCYFKKLYMQTGVHTDKAMFLNVDL